MILSTRGQPDPDAGRRVASSAERRFSRRHALRLRGAAFGGLSVHDWDAAGAGAFIGLNDYTSMPTDQRFQLSIVRTLYYAVLTVVAPLLLGSIAAVLLHRQFRFRGLARGFAVVLAGRETRTLPVAVFRVLIFEQLAWGNLAAAALIVTLPVLMITVFIQRQIVLGVTAGAVKGWARVR